MIEQEAAENALKSTSDPAWVLNEDGFEPPNESSREARFVVSNGFLGVRGVSAIHQAGPETAAPVTYIAGLFDRGAGEAKHVLVPATDSVQVRILLNAEPLARTVGDASAIHMTLDLRRGLLLTEEQHLVSRSINLCLRSLRLVSLSERALGLQVVQLEVEGGDVEITLEALSEGVNPNLVPKRLGQGLGVWRTMHSRKTLSVAASPSLQVGGNELVATMVDEFRWRWRWTARPGKTACFAHAVAVVRSDIKDMDLGQRAQDKIDSERQLGWSGVVTQHEAAWAGRWRCSDVEIEGDAEAQRALRFALYHLNSAANPADERVSIAARGLTGNDYHGHVFWDTEIFLLPFYILTWPEAARALLMYRFHTLDAARAKARKLGWRGALYAWESAATGSESAPEHVIGPNGQSIEILPGTEEQHISADIAYAVWQYWQATGDEDFLLHAGAEILLETARFWTSRAQPEADGRRHIRRVIGPDEYHDNIDDNAYTNSMARWNILHGLAVASMLRERWPEYWKLLSRQLSLGDAELQRWLNIAESIATGFDPRTRLFEQFAGYFGLEDINLAAYADRTVPMDVILGRERTRQSQVIKQADVVMLLALLPEVFAPGAAEANFQYYDPRCGHGSSLSRVMHGFVAARLGKVEMALRYFREAATIDLSDSQGAITGGVHIATQGGLWMTAVFGFAGLSLCEDGLVIDPDLPAEWRSLTFGAHWRGRRVKIRIERATGRLEATLESGAPMPIFVRSAPHMLSLDQPLVVFIENSANVSSCAPDGPNVLDHRSARPVPGVGA
jgi:trehalose/maltose hydrolase-like predicted phosphorylase